MELSFSEACERNKKPILKALGAVMPERGCVLEIGSGTGQHVVYFAAALPNLTWQPSDRSEYLEGLAHRIRAEGGPNILDPIELDVLTSWPGQAFDAVFSSNTAHIMSWQAVQAMFAGVGELLSPGAAFSLYGPFNENGRYTAESNRSFDQGLRARDPLMGLRDVSDLETLANGHQLFLENMHRMPANNRMLVFRKRIN